MVGSAQGVPLDALARNYRRVSRAVGGWYSGAFAVDVAQVSRQQLETFYNTWIGCVVKEHVAGILAWEGIVYAMQLTLDGAIYEISLDPERWHNNVDVYYSDLAVEDIDQGTLSYYLMDVEQGALILPAGHTIQPQDIGALLALGMTADLPVRKRPLVSLFSTGDELVPPDVSVLRPGQIRDINSSTIQALCQRAGARTQLHPLVSDTPGALFAVLEAALPEADMLVVTAGSSVSARDLTAETLNRLGAPGVLVHGVAARPGKPTILAVVEGKPVIGLPGNPVSAMVMFTLFGLSLIHI